jgi:hypothetical protein
MPYLASATYQLIQDGDGNDSAPQTLEITIENCGADPYLILRTVRWAIDGPNEMQDVLGPLFRTTAPLFTMFEYSANKEVNSDECDAAE